MRGPGSNTLSSPNMSPTPSRARRFSRPSRAVRASFTLPLTMTYIASPVAPSRKIISPRVNSRRTIDGDQRARVLGVHAAEQRGRTQRVLLLCPVLCHLTPPSYRAAPIAFTMVARHSLQVLTESALIRAQTRDRSRRCRCYRVSVARSPPVQMAAASSLEVGASAARASHAASMFASGLVGAGHLRDEEVAARLRGGGATTGSARARAASRGAGDADRPPCPRLRATCPLPSPPRSRDRACTMYRPDGAPP